MYGNVVSSCLRNVTQRHILQKSSGFIGKQSQVSTIINKFHMLSCPPKSLTDCRNTFKFDSRNLSGTTEKPVKVSSPGKIIGTAILAGALLSGLYSYWRLKREEASILKFTRSQTTNDSSAKDYFLASAPPYLEPAKKIRNSDNEIGVKLTLYQYQTCPFCCKARVFLDYFGFNYDIVEVNSVMRTQVKWSSYKKVPIVVAELKNGRVIQLNDSTLIISVLKSLLQDNAKSLEEVIACYPKMSSIDLSGKETTEVMNKYFLMFQDENIDKAQMKKISEERKWRLWVDNTLVHMLSPNVYRTMSESLEAFRWFDKAGNWESLFSSWERTLVIYTGAFVMWMVARKLKKRHQLKPDVRQSLYDEINFWLKTIKSKGTPFMGGESPDLSDLAVYGVLNAIEGCEAFDDLARNTKIMTWYSAMRESCTSHGGQAALLHKSSEQ